MPNRVGAIARDGLWDVARLGSAVWLNTWAEEQQWYKDFAGATSDFAAFTVSIVASLALAVFVFNLLLARSIVDMTWSDLSERYTLTSINLSLDEPKEVEFKAHCARPSVLALCTFGLLRITGGGLIVTFDGSTDLAVTPEQGSAAVVNYQSKALFVSARALAVANFQAWADVRFVVNATAVSGSSSVRGALVLWPGVTVPFSGLLLRQTSSLQSIDSRR